VEPVAVAEVPQDVLRVEGRMCVIHQLGKAQRAHCRDFKLAALESESEA